MIDLRLHDAGNLAVPLRAAPHLPFRPKGQLAQLVNSRVIVAGMLIGQRQGEWIENAGFAAEQLQQSCRLLDT